MQRCLAMRQSWSGSEESSIYLSKPFKSVETFSQRSDLREDPQKEHWPNTQARSSTAGFRLAHSETGCNHISLLGISRSSYWGMFSIQI